MLFYLRIIFKVVLNKVTVNNLTISATTNPLMGTTPPRVSKGTILKHPLIRISSVELLVKSYHGILHGNSKVNHDMNYNYNFGRNEAGNVI